MLALRLKLRYLQVDQARPWVSRGGQQGQSLPGSFRAAGQRSEGADNRTDVCCLMLDLLVSPSQAGLLVSASCLLALAAVLDTRSCNEALPFI